MEIIINNLLDIEVDKVSSGTVVDVLSNASDPEAVKQPLLDALIAREESFNQQISDLQSQIASIANTYQGKIDAITAANAAFAVQIEEAVAANDPALLSKIVEDAKDPVIAKKKIELQAEIDRLNAEETKLQEELDALD